MQNVLLLADLHGKYEKMDLFLDMNPDAVFLAGDLTNMGPAEAAEELISRIDVPTFAIPGNCDPPEMVEYLECSDCVCIHGTCFCLGRISILGVGGSNPTPFGTLFEMEDNRIESILAGAISRRENAMHNVLISHAPPFGILDRAGGTHVGSRSIRRHLSDFDLVCCAHIHEDKGITDIEGVKVVNPGMAAAGDCAMIHFGSEPKAIQIELINV
jgi:hypothetical protein